MGTEPPNTRLVWGFAATGAVASLLVVALLDLRLLPTGVYGQWQWPWREAGFTASPLILLTLPLYAVLLAVYLYQVSRPKLRLRHCALVVVLACLTAGATMALKEAGEPAMPLHLASSTASSMAMGYFGYATALPDASSLLRAYSRRPPTLAPMPGRVLTHTPGPVLVFYWGQRFLDAFPVPVQLLQRYLAQTYGLTPEVLHRACRWYIMPSVTADHLFQAIILGAMVTLLGSLLPLPAYFLGAALGGRAEGLLAALLAALIPSLLVFVPSIEGVAALLALTVLATWLWALRHQRLWLYALSGLGFFLATFWTLGTAAVAPVMLVSALPALRELSTGKWYRAPVVVGMLITAATCVGLHLLLHLTWGYNLFLNLRVITDQQRLEMALAHRDYLTWLTRNPYDFILFMGPVLVSLVAARMASSRHAPPLARCYAAGALLAFALVWLSGSTLAEVGRIWLFLMAVLTPVAGGLANLPEKPRSWLLGVTVAAQLGLTLALHSNLSLVMP